MGYARIGGRSRLLQGTGFPWFCCRGGALSPRWGSAQIGGRSRLLQGTGFPWFCCRGLCPPMGYARIGGRNGQPDISALEERNLPFEPCPQRVGSCFVSCSGPWLSSTNGFVSQKSACSLRCSSSCPRSLPTASAEFGFVRQKSVDDPPPELGSFGRNLAAAPELGSFGRICRGPGIGFVRQKSVGGTAWFNLCGPGWVTAFGPVPVTKLTRNRERGLPRVARGIGKPPFACASGLVCPVCHPVSNHAGGSPNWVRSVRSHRVRWVRSSHIHPLDRARRCIADRAHLRRQAAQSINTSSVASFGACSLPLASLGHLQGRYARPLRLIDEQAVAVNGVPHHIILSPFRAHTPRYSHVFQRP